MNSLGQRDKEPLLLLLAAKAEDGLLSEAIDCDESSRHHRDAAELLDNQGIADVARAGAAILLRIGQSEITHASHLLRQLKGELSTAVDLHSCRLY